VWGEDRLVELWNPAAEKTFGFTRDEVTGKHPFDFLLQTRSTRKFRSSSGNSKRVTCSPTTLMKTGPRMVVRLSANGIIPLCAMLMVGMPVRFQWSTT
jgi:PAS domain S-box-containing protein